MSNPIKPSFKTEWFPLALIVLSFLAGAYFYQNFPVTVPSHWNFQGEIDGYSSAGVAAFLLPFMTLGIYLLFVFIPYLDPKKAQYSSFGTSYHQFKGVFVAFMSLLYALTGLNGLGYTINIGFWTPVMVGCLFCAIGLLMEKVKSNWFLGVRTPWSLSSDKVWDKTHKLSGQLFILAGALMAATVLVSPVGKIVLFSLSLAILIIGAPLSSYIFYLQEKKDNK